MLERPREVADGAETGLVRRRAVVEDGDPSIAPLHELRVESGVRHDDDLVEASYRFELIHEVTYDRFSSDREKWLGAIFRQRVHARTKARAQKNGLHSTRTPSSLSTAKTLTGSLSATAATSSTSAATHPPKPAPLNREP